MEEIKADREGKGYTYRGHDVDDTVELIIVDEVDRHKLAGLEQIRDVYDQSDIGMVLIGMLGIEKRLARYPQLYSHIGFAHEFKKLSNDEMKFILQY